MKIAVIDDVTLTAAQEERLRRCGDVRVFSGVPTERDEILKRAADADIVIASWTKLPASVLQCLPDLKLLSIWATGYDDVDVAAATRQGVMVCHVPGYATEAVAEMTFALILSIARRILPADNDVRAVGTLRWERFQGLELQGKVLGVIGTGAIGARVAEIAGAFGLKPIACDASPREELVRRFHVEYLSIEDVLARSDIVSLHLPLTESTVSLFSYGHFARMKPSALFINTARAAIVDQDALWDALDTGKIAAAGLDDLDLGRPGARRFLEAESVVLTPHIGFNTGEAILKKTDICIENVVRFLQGNPCHIVNPSVVRTHLRLA